MCVSVCVGSLAAGVEPETGSCRVSFRVFLYVHIEIYIYRNANRRRAFGSLTLIFANAHIQKQGYLGTIHTQSTHTHTHSSTDSLVVFVVVVVTHIYVCI